MSGALAAVSTVGGLAGQLAPIIPGGSSLMALIRAPRSIDTIVPDVTIEESHDDRLVVTQHPIADGSSVSDHAYKVPATVTMRVGFTNANPIGAAVQGFQSGGGFGDLSGGLAGAGQGLVSSLGEGRVKDIYKKLLKLQFDQQAWDQGNTAVNTFQLVTGKRTYPSMVITEISIRTDRTSEYSLMVECHMQEVFIVKTKSTTQPAQTDQQQPAKTASPTDQPDKQPNAPPADGGPSPLKRLIDGTGSFFGIG